MTDFQLSPTLTSAIHKQKLILSVSALVTGSSLATIWFIIPGETQEIDPRIQELVQRIGSYTEIGPNPYGYSNDLRIIGYADGDDVQREHHRGVYSVMVDRRRGLDVPIGGQPYLDVPLINIDPAIDKLVAEIDQGKWG